MQIRDLRIYPYVAIPGCKLDVISGRHHIYIVEQGESLINGRYTVYQCRHCGKRALHVEIFWDDYWPSAWACHDCELTGPDYVR